MFRNQGMWKLEQDREPELCPTLFSSPLHFTSLFSLGTDTAGSVESMIMTHHELCHTVTSSQWQRGEASGLVVLKQLQAWLHRCPGCTPAWQGWHCTCLQHECQTLTFPAAPLAETTWMKEIGICRDSAKERGDQEQPEVNGRQGKVVVSARQCQ